MTNWQWWSKGAEQTCSTRWKPFAKRSEWGLHRYSIDSLCCHLKTCRKTRSRGRCFVERVERKCWNKRHSCHTSHPLFHPICGTHFNTPIAGEMRCFLQSFRIPGDSRGLCLAGGCRFDRRGSLSRGIIERECCNWVTNSLLCPHKIGHIQVRIGRRAAGEWSPHRRGKQRTNSLL